MEISRLLAVVAFDRELDRLDPTKVLLRQRHLTGRDVHGIGFEVVADLADQRADHVHVPDAETGGLLVEVVPELRTHQCEHDHGLLGGRAFQNGGQATSVSNTPLELQPHAMVGELKERSSRYSLGSLASRVAYNVDDLRIHWRTAQPRRPSLRPCIRLTRRRFFAFRFALRRAALLRLRGRSLLAMFRYMNYS